MIAKMLFFTKLAFIIFLMLSLSSCSCIVESNSCAVYKIKGKDLYYNHCSISAANFGCESVLVSENIDKKTFQVIDKFANVNDYPLYAKDKNTMFFGKSIIVDADPLTYEFIDSEYGKDKNHVYLQGKIIKGADPKTYSIGRTTNHSNQPVNITSDKNDYYLQGVPLGVDVNTFIILNEEVLKDDIVHAKDKTYYYVITINMPISSYLPIDKLAKKFTVSDIDSLELLGDGYAKDKNQAYYYGEIILDADAKTLKNLGNKFAVDGMYVYVEGEKVTHIDPDSFYVSTTHGVKGIDKNGCYSNYKGTKLKNCN